MIAYGVVGAICIAAIGIAFYYIGKYEILKNSSALAIDIVGLAVVFSLITIFLLMAVLRINLSWKTTLPKAVEFSSAMRKLGFLDFDTQLTFVSGQEMNVFIADKPLLHDIQENVRAKRYKFLAHKDVLSSHNGKRRLCLGAEEYNRVVHGVTPFSVLESTAVAEKEEKIAMLYAELLSKTTALENIVIENTSLKKECDDLKSSANTAPGRSKKNDNFHAIRAPFWLVAVPLIKRLHQESKADTVYSKDTIQTEFERELNNYPAFKPAIKALLSTNEKIAENTPFSLDGWGMRAICDVLSEYGVNIKNTPGPESKK